MKLAKFVNKLRNVYQDKIEAIVLFGSAAIDNHTAAKKCDVMILFKALKLSDMTRGSSLIRRWMAAGHPEPLLIDLKHLQESLDVFPMEFADMQARHRILWGESPLPDLIIHREHLRLQCEREVKQLLLTLRERLVAAYPRRGPMRRILRESAGALIAIMRGSLRVVGHEVPDEEDRVLQAFRREMEIEAESLAPIVATRQGRRLRKSAVPDLIEPYLTSLENLATVLDNL